MRWQQPPQAVAHGAWHACAPLAPLPVLPGAVRPSRVRLLHPKALFLSSATLIWIRRVKLEASRRKHEALKARLEGEFGRLDSLEAKVARLEELRGQEQVITPVLCMFLYVVQGDAVRVRPLRCGPGMRAGG